MINKELAYILITGFIASFTLGFLTNIFILKKNRNLRIFILLYFIFYLQKIILLLKTLFKDTVFFSRYIEFPINILNKLYGIGFIIILIYFIHQIFCIAFRKKIIIITAIIYVIPWLFQLLINYAVIIIPNPDFRSFLFNIDYLPFLAYILIICFNSYKKIKSQVIKRLGKATLIIISAIFFIILMDSLFESFLNINIPKDPIIIICFSFIYIHYSITYLKFADKSNTILSDDFITKLKISKRECEIIELLIKGYSYKNIASKLLISFATVKTHVHNIYQKTKVQSRYELLHLLAIY